MISRSELEQLLSNLESDRIERTTSTNNNDKFAEAITAFANDLPHHRQNGYLLIGVSDNGSLSGLSVSDQLLQNLAAIRSDGNIQPLPVLHVAKFDFGEQGEIAVVEVAPSDLPPVRYKGRVWVRVGPRRAIATEQEERLLTERRISHALTFDALPCRSATLADLAIDQFKVGYLPQVVAEEILEQNHRDIVEQLASLRFYDITHQCPTFAGVILFGKNPLHHLPGAYVQYLKINGTSLGDEIIDQKEISGDLLSVMRELDLLVNANLESAPKPESALRERNPVNYPKPAIRELLNNAIMHRTYQSTAPVRFYWFRDHVEIQNPGGLYGEATRQNFPQQNSYRNPVLAEALKALGYVNRFGGGVVRAQSLLRSNGNGEAEFNLQDEFVGVTIRRRP